MTFLYQGKTYYRAADLVRAIQYQITMGDLIK